jgi:hypothetical protein
VTYTYLLHLHFPSGTVKTITCASAFARGLRVVALAAAPVRVELEDVPDVEEVCRAWYAADGPPEDRS